MLTARTASKYFTLPRSYGSNPRHPLAVMHLVVVLIYGLCRVIAHRCWLPDQLVETPGTGCKVVFRTSVWSQATKQSTQISSLTITIIRCFTSLDSRFGRHEKKSVRGRWTIVTRFMYYITLVYICGWYNTIWIQNATYVENLKIKNLRLRFWGKNKNATSLYLN